MNETSRADTPTALATAQLFATIAYAQLVAESAVHLNVPPAMVAVIFHALISDFNVATLTLASCRGSKRLTRF
jgi:hypothetical protein